MRRAPRVDGNHREVVRALTAAGCSVVSLAGVGFGVPDLLVGRGRQTYLVEIKEPGGSLRASQVAWLARWRGGRVVLAHDIEEALQGLREGR